MNSIINFMKRFTAFVLCIINLMGAVPAVQAEDTSPDIVLAPPVTITMVYPNAPGSAEKGGEFFILHNSGDEDVLLDGFSVAVNDTPFKQFPNGITIDANADLIVLPTFASLLNGGATLHLQYPSPLIEPQEVTYPANLKEENGEIGEKGTMWALIDGSWQVVDFVLPAEDTPELVLAAETEEQPEETLPPDSQIPDDTEPPEIVCNVQDVSISEIVANPAGADTAGGEFIELHNADPETANLNSCTLSTDKLALYTFTAADTIAPGGYYVLELADDLLNGGGTVLLTTAEEHEVSYPTLGDDEAWAFINNAWQVTELSTPGTTNKPTPPEPAVTEEEEGLESCLSGKFRNPETNRCKNIIDTASSLLPCDVGESRNPLTNRCRKIGAATSSLTPCRPGYTRNPATNRCRNTAATSNSLVPCKPGYERSPETNRCRKGSGSVAGVAAFPPTVGGSAPLHSGLLISITSLVLLYGIYEYRPDLGNLYARLRGKFAKE